MISLITTAGLYFDDQQPFDRDTPTGDASYRPIPADGDLTRLRLWWDVEQKQPASQDLNCAFPLELLRESCGIAPLHYSFSGNIPESRPLRDETGPRVARELREHAVDAVIIAPS